VKYVNNILDTRPISESIICAQPENIFIRSGAEELLIGISYICDEYLDRSNRITSDSEILLSQRT
jgi:hypothetical protein